MTLMKKILVTGATGFLGSAVVASLLEKVNIDSLLLLVRANDACEGLERIRQALNQLEVPTSISNDLTESQILLGDLRDVSLLAIDPRIDSITHVINCAAIASFGKNPLIWPVNVDATFAFAERMARVKSLVRFLHIGTAMACGPTMQSPVEESWEFAPEDEHLVPYTASKAAIEQKIRQELPGLPLVVARPSIVVGHSTLGCKPSGSIFWVFRMAQLLEQFTCSLDERIDVIPVDYCADMLTTLALKDQLAHDLYHISAGPESSCTFGELEIAFAEGLGVPPIGNRYRQIDYHEFDKLAQEFQTRAGPCNKRLVLRALQLYAGFADLNYVFDNSRMLKEAVLQPPQFSSYIGLCAATSKHISIQEQMRWDFK